MTDLAGTQLSSLLETLPGIATVLRSPVADAMVGLVRAASGQGSFSFADVEELMRYAVRRNLIPADESERVLAETREAVGPIVANKPKPVKPVPPRVVVAKPVVVKPIVARPAAKPTVAKPAAAKARKPAKAAAKPKRVKAKAPAKKKARTAPRAAKKK